MMITLINFESGELKIANGKGDFIRLTQDQANRLIMAARMHAVDPFISKLPALIEEEKIREEILALFFQAERSERWNLKERLARLRTVSKGYQAESPEEIVETLSLTP